MTNLQGPHDFNEYPHRIAAAAALLQKGVYHLFVAKQQTDDAFGKILRLYQSLFQLCSALALMDDSVDLNAKASRLQGPLRKHCSDQTSPSRAEIDPAAVLTHSMFDVNGWRGLRRSHPLHTVSVQALALFRRVVEARHNLIYRPFLLSRDSAFYWEDCPLLDLIAAMPEREEVEAAYRTLRDVLCEESGAQNEEFRRRLAGIQKQGAPEAVPGTVPRLWAIHLRDQLRLEYRDVRDSRPTETILLTYARMLSGDDQQFLEELRTYAGGLLAT